MVLWDSTKKRKETAILVYVLDEKTAERDVLSAIVKTEHPGAKVRAFYPEAQRKETVSDAPDVLIARAGGKNGQTEEKIPRAGVDPVKTNEIYAASTGVNAMETLSVFTSGYLLLPTGELHESGSEEALQDCPRPVGRSRRHRGIRPISPTEERLCRKSGDPRL